MDSKNCLLLLFLIGIVAALPRLPTEFEDLIRESEFETDPVFGP